MRQHYYDMDTVSQVGMVTKKYRKQMRRRQLARAALKAAGLAIVFGLIGAMLAFRG